MDIDDRAEKWADAHSVDVQRLEEFFREDLVAAYLAGSAQTQRDYTAHYAAERNMRNWHDVAEREIREYPQPGPR